MKSTLLSILVAMLLVSLSFGQAAVSVDVYNSDADVIKATVKDHDNVQVWTFNLDIDDGDDVVLRLPTRGKYSNAGISARVTSSQDSVFIGLQHGFSNNLPHYVYSVPVLLDSANYYFKSNLSWDLPLETSFGTSEYLILKITGGYNLPSAGALFYLTVTLRKD